MARVIRPRGVHGELVCDIITDFPERFERTATLYLGDPPRARAVRSAQCVGSIVQIKLAGVDTRDQAETLRGAWLMVPEAEAEPLPPGEYYWHQLIGLDVITEEGRRLGCLTEILETGSNDVYVVCDDSRELLIPATKDVIRGVDLEGHRMAVRLLPGLEAL